MEQKQLDEMEEQFYGDEFIDEDDFNDQEVKIVEDSSIKKRKSSSRKSKIATKKSSTKKTSKTVKEKVVKEDFKTDNNGYIEVKTEEVKKPLDNKIDVIKEPKEQKNVFSEKKPVETLSKVDPWDEEDNKEPSESMFKNISTWKFLTGIVIVLLIFSVLTQGFNFSNNIVGGASAISLNEADQKVLSFVNDNLMQPPFTAELISSEEVGDMYKVILDVGGEEVETFVSKDGKYFFPQGFDIESLNSLEVETVEVSLDDDAIKGDANAPITIVEFSEFECPYCGKYYQDTYSKLVENYVDTGKVKYVFRDFPLSFHANAQKAAEAAECAGEQNKYWEMHDKLFENQDALTVSNLKIYAKQLGLDTTEFNDCLDNGEMEEEVLKDLEEGMSYGVQGTPAFFINGKMLSGAQPFEVFEQEIEAALATIKRVEAEEITNEPVEPIVKDNTETTETTETELLEEVVEEISNDPVTTTGDTKEFTLNSKKWSFTPDTIEVNEGDSVKLNILPDDSNPSFSLSEFTFLIPELGVEETISGATTITFTATKLGTFEFKCGSCDDWRGMKGIIVVE